MQILFYFVITVHVIVCIFLIGVVLLQQGRSADLAGAFGGQGSQTAFGPRAAANVLTRLTTWSAVIFMLTSLTLTVLYVRSTGTHSVLENAKPAPLSAPAKPTKNPLSQDLW
jgi:preprotein translocase subunit SecG